MSSRGDNVNNVMTWQLMGDISIRSSSVCVSLGTLFIFYLGGGEGGGRV